MKKTKFVLIIAILLITGFKSYTQIQYSMKFETGYLIFKRHTIQIDPGPGWKGYNLKGHDGCNLNVINGIKFNDKIFVGVGIGYSNFNGSSGISAYSDLEYLPLKTKLSPLINFKVGYNHLWNQNKNGTGTTMAEFNLGMNYRVTPKLGAYIKSGVLFMQQSMLIPLSLGVRF